MRTILKVMGVVALAGLLLIAGLFAVASYAERETAARVPEFTWSPSPTEVLAMDAASARQWNFGHAGKVLVRISADSPVSFMVSDPDSIRSAIVPSNGMNAPRLQPSGSCAGADILQSEKTCEVNTGDVLIVQDSRGLNEQVSGIAGIVFGRNSTAMNAANMKSRVTLNISIWRCVRNC